nr:hypothetical protein Iba_chr05cCG11540 [Ipomoea batatas]
MIGNFVFKEFADDFQRHKSVVSHPEQLRELVNPPGSGGATGSAQMSSHPGYRSLPWNPMANTSRRAYSSPGRAAAAASSLGYHPHR